MPWIAFGVFEFDTETRELRRGGRPVHLQPQPARMLAALLQSPGEPVSREVLQQAIWGSDTHVDFERGLNFCAAQIRAALRDSASQPRYIETIPRRGYRFIAPVQPRALDASEPASVAPGRPAIGPRVVAGAAVLLVLAGAAALSFFRAARMEVEPPTIAVVPFQNETGSTEFAATAKNLSDGTVTRLATPERLSRVRVIGNASVLRFTFARRDLQRMGQSLGAEFIVLGQLKGGASGLRVVAHLIRVSDQTHVWAETFDRGSLGLEEQSSVADAIARAVVDRVGVPDPR